MDITIDLSGYCLNIRAAVIIEHQNCILFHHNLNSDHYALLGGRVKIGEASEETVKREILEELGKEICITGYIATIENLFEMKGKQYHEIMFVYQADFVNQEDKQEIKTMNNQEGEKYLQYEWIKKEDLHKIPLKPEKMKDILSKGQFPIHCINID